MVDTGLMRKNEFKFTSKILKKNINLILRLLTQKKIYLNKLKNVQDPEKKRKLLGIFLLKFLKRKQKI